MAKTVPIWKRPVDIFMCLLLCYYLWSAVCIERFYCAAPLDPNSPDAILRATYEYAEKYNPLFLSRPEWLKVATCISWTVLGSGYILSLVTFILGLNTMRVPLLMFCSFKIYALLIYYWIELFGENPTPDVVMFLAADGPYLVGLLLTLYRMRTATPFPTVTEPTTKKKQ